MDAYDLKTPIEALLQAFAIRDVQWAPADAAWLHPRSATELRVGDLSVGLLGEAHPDLMTRYGLEGPPVFLAELDIDALQDHQGPLGVFRPLAKHPPSQRDLSFFLGEDVPAADVLNAIRGAPAEVPMESVTLFDVYEGEGVPDGQKSLAVKITFRAEARTLTDAEVDAAQAVVMDTLRDRFDAQIREG